MKLEVYGALGRCPECVNLKRYLDNKFHAYSFVDVDVYADTRAELNIKRIPVLILRDDDGQELRRVTSFNQNVKADADSLLSELIK